MCSCACVHINKCLVGKGKTTTSSSCRGWWQHGCKVYVTFSRPISHFPSAWIIHLHIFALCRSKKLVCLVVRYMCNTNSSWLGWMRCLTTPFSCQHPESYYILLVEIFKGCGLLFWLGSCRAWPFRAAIATSFVLQIMAIMSHVLLHN